VHKALLRWSRQAGQKKGVSSVMTAKNSGALPDKRRKYDEAFKAEVLR
jgi:hypothetical protein